MLQEQDCKACGGIGQLGNFDYDETWECWNCEGTGKVSVWVQCRG